MQVELKNPELGRYIDEQVKAGRFPSAEAMVEDALTRMMEEDVSMTADDVAAISEADAQIDRGESVDFDEFAASMREKHGIK